MWLHYTLIGSFIVLGFVFNYNKISQRIYLILSFFIITVLITLRGPNVGNDTKVYLDLYTQISNSTTLEGVLARFEKGYIYLNKLLTLISSNPQVIIIVSGGFISLCFYLFIRKYSKIYWLSLVLFITLGYFGMTMNSIRMYMAMSILLIAVTFLLKNKNLLFILTVLFASQFHTTALVFLILLLLKRVKLTFKTQIILIVSTVLVAINFNLLLKIVLMVLPKYSYYLGTEFIPDGIKVGPLLNIMLAFVTLYTLQYIKKHPSEDNSERFERLQDLSLKMLTISLCLFIVSIKFPILANMANYFWVISIVAIPNIISSLKESKLKILVCYMFSLMFIIYSLVTLYFRPEWNLIYPYEFFFIF